MTHQRIDELPVLVPRFLLVSGCLGVCCKTFKQAGSNFCLFVLLNLLGCGRLLLVLLNED